MTENSPSNGNTHSQTKGRVSHLSVPQTCQQLLSNSHGLRNFPCHGISSVNTTHLSRTSSSFCTLETHTVR